jgi:CBS-domain-containing membrane protein
MSKAFTPLSFNTLEYSVGYFRPRQELPDRVKDTSPALDVMTDLRQVAVLMVSSTTPLNMALERMIKSGVRMLLVTDANGRVLGLITSRDVQGEKPTKILEKTGGTLKDLVVGDIMTLKNRLEVLMMKDVLHARVGDIIATLKEAGRQHAIVVDTDPHNGELAVRGIFSLSQIGQQLGLQIDPTQRATTFDDLEWALQHSPKP